MRKSAILVIILTLLAKVFGFGRDIVLSYFYGTTYISDAYLITIIIGVSIFGIIGKAVTSSFIPLYKEVEVIEDQHKANTFFSNVFNFMTLVIIILIILVIVFANQIVGIFASGFEKEEFELTVMFTRISIAGLSLVTLINILSGFLQIKGNHRLPALISLPLNIVVIIMIFLSSKYSIILLPIGLVLGSLLQFLIVYFVSYKYGYKFQSKLNVKNYSMRKLIKNSRTVLIGSSSQQINTIIDRALASQIIEGGVSAISYANRLNGFVQSVFVLSITAVMYPVLSKEAIENNEQKFNSTLRYSLSSMAIVIIPVSMFILIFAEEIVTLLFGRGNFTQESINLTTGPLIFYSLGMISFAYREVLNRAFYAHLITRTPLINSIIGVSINIVLNFILSSFMGINGLALATSISASITTTLLFISYKKMNNNFSMTYLLVIFLKTVLSAIVMAIVTMIIHPVINENFNQWITMMLTVSLGGLVYSILLILFRVNEFKDLIKLFLNRLIYRKTK